MKKRIAPKRHGTSATEVIVAATLLLSMIGLVVPTTVRTGRIWRDSRHYQIAMNELSNQFEYLSSLSDAERTSALAKLQVSEQARRSLQDTRLEASLASNEDGLRLTLSLNWDRGVDAMPIKIVGWLTASTNDSPTVQVENDTSKEVADETT
jgi:hypothetical protein